MCSNVTDCSSLIPSMMRQGIFSYEGSSLERSSYAALRLWPEIICHDPSPIFLTSGMSVRPFSAMERASLRMLSRSME